MAEQQRSQAPPATTTTKTQRETDAEQAAELLKVILDRSPSAAYKATDMALWERVEKLREVLPDNLKDQAERFVKRAMLTFERRPELQACSATSFIRCVLAAAELGLAIDGRLAHAVPFNNKIKDKVTGKDRWVKEAQFMPDYKGLVAVAKRCGAIKDCRAELVCQNDSFRHGQMGAKCVLEHTWDIHLPRGAVIGAFAVIVRPDGDFGYSYMDLEELKYVRSKSKAKDAGPWVDWTGEMQKKTVLKRALKLYVDDPAVVRALEIDDTEYDDAPVSAPAFSEPPVGRVPVRNGVKPSAPEPQESFDPFASEGDDLPPSQPRDPEGNSPPPGEGRQPGDEPIEDNHFDSEEDDRARQEWADTFQGQIDAAATERDLMAVSGHLSFSENVLGEDRLKTLKSAVEAKLATFPKPQKNKK